MEKKSKTVEMDSKPKQGEKMSYEQLEQLAFQLNNTCKQMHQKLAEAERAINEVNEISILLDVLKRGENFSKEFVTRCAAKIEKIVGEALDAEEKTGDN